MNRKVASDVFTELALSSRKNNVDSGREPPNMNQTLFYGYAAVVASCSRYCNISTHSFDTWVMLKSGGTESRVVLALGCR